MEKNNLLRELNENEMMDVFGGRWVNRIIDGVLQTIWIN